MAKFVCLLVILAFIQASYAIDKLKCYQCGLQGMVDCKDTIKDNPTNLCTAQGANYDMYCAKEIMNGKITRRCYNDVKGAKTDCMDKNGKKVCLCQSDLCNSSSTVSISSFAFLGMAAAYFAHKIFLH